MITTTFRRSQLSYLPSQTYHANRLCLRFQHAQTHHALPHPTITPQTISNASTGPRSTPPPPLSLLPLPSLLRSYAFSALSSSPLLLTFSLRLLSKLANSRSTILNPDRNPLIHLLLKKTFYAQFCAGENPREVLATVSKLRKLGFSGIILSYAKEIVLFRNETVVHSVPTHTTIGNAPGAEAEAEAEAEAATSHDVRVWKTGTLSTVSMTSAGDFIALKCSGAGRTAMRLLASCSDPSTNIEAAMMEICELAKARGVRLLFDAEQDVVQPGIDAWTLEFQQRFNKRDAVVYGTYQAYLRSTPEVLARHLLEARRKGFVLGVKLVRGAYMGSDPPHLFWDSKEKTDEIYDGITDAVIRKRWNGVLKPVVGAEGAKIPEVAVMLATHNQVSVSKAMKLRQVQRKEERVEMAYGQLMGMADEVSGELVLAGQKSTKQGDVKSLSQSDADDTPKAYKYLVWGSVGECLKYLIRRGEENKDAVVRAEGTRLALGREIRRRIWG